MTFTITSTLSREDYIKALKLIRRPKVIRIAMLYLIVIVFFGVDLLGRSGDSKKTDMAMFVIVALCSSFMISTFAARRKWRSIQPITIVQYTFSEEGVYAVSADWTNNIAWARVHKLVWTKQFLLVYYDSGNTIAIPLALFTREQKEFISRCIRS